jgi:hypothetical protein
VCGEDHSYSQLLLVPRNGNHAAGWKLREVGSGVVPCRAGLPREKQTVTELKLESREVEQQVVCVGKPEGDRPPATATRSTSPRVVKTVKVKVYETVPVQRG